MDTFSLAVSPTALQIQGTTDPYSDMWFRILVKTLSSQSASSYKWHEMTFCFRWDLEHYAILCIGVDPTFQKLLKEVLYRMWPELPPAEPCAMLVPLMEVIIAMYDQSIWSVRDIVRISEKVSTTLLRGATRTGLTSGSVGSHTSNAWAR
jgi:hypothetical protein